MKKSSKKTVKSQSNETGVQRVYFTNTTNKNIQVGKYVFEPDDPKSIPIELEKEAREKGLV